MSRSTTGMKPPVAPAHFQHVAKAGRRDQADAPALALQQRIGADGGTVDDAAEPRDRAERA